METFRPLIVMLLSTFLVNGKCVDLHKEATSDDYDIYPKEANGARGTDGPDVVLYAVAGAAGIAVVGLLCYGIYHIYRKRKNPQKDSIVLIESGKKLPRKHVTGTGQRTSFKLVKEGKANNRVTFKKKILKARRYAKGLRKSEKRREPAEGTPLLAKVTSGSNRNRDHSNRNDQEVTGKRERPSVHRNIGVQDKEHGKRHLSMFDTKYKVLHAIGKGGFGLAKLALRRSDSEQVVVKFIVKSKICFWTLNDNFERVPQEVAILTRLSHPNIVKVIDVFENPEFVKMVMEKHGSGMDLVDFIFRKTHCFDEALCSFIFRQMVDAISYLHSISIVHRDIKEQNIIIDEHFHVKLIDFGAATYFGEGRKFRVFWGTFKYCSPEVLLGNMYNGPEQDMWALGVTLYGLMFTAFPFADEKDTIDCKLNVPCAVSSSMSFLLTSLLTADPKRRATIFFVEQISWVTQHVNISNYRWCDVVK